MSGEKSLLTLWLNAEKEITDKKDFRIAGQWKDCESCPCFSSDGHCSMDGHLNDGA